MGENHNFFSSKFNPSGLNILNKSSQTANKLQSEECQYSIKETLTDLKSFRIGDFFVTLQFNLQNEAYETRNIRTWV